ncbi:2'-5' RNA ligase [Methylophaga sp. 42_25_T18]|nr:2'-5' RNA ligase [Methylophaga sp. 42_25_T18]OUR89752.1 2'-5' RNA ligase [Methylophaga sp. 42_8_T64]
MKRLFFALWPDDATRQKIIQFDNSLTDPRLKKVRSKNLHVTLVFIGNIESEQEDNIIKAVDDVFAPVIDMQFDQLTLWLQKRGILSLTSSFQPSALLNLVEQLKNIVLAQDVEIENRPYTAHITLARNIKKQPELEVDPPIQWQSDNFVLVHSVSTGRGVDYQVINTWPLVAK